MGIYFIFGRYDDESEDRKRNALSENEEEYNKHPEFDKANLIERLCIPDRVYQFRVTWGDDKGNVCLLYTSPPV